jgi:flavorubredoxin
MEQPTMIGTREIAPDLCEIVSYLPVPGQGILPVNAFVIRGEQPMLIDTGLGALRDGFLDALAKAVSPADIRWIWLSHMDADHIGNLGAVLEHAPHARVVTNFLGMGKMMLLGLPVERVHMLAPGDRLDLGDRTITAFRPPYYDAPETMGWFDSRSRALFAADAFGALMQAPAEEARSLPAEALRQGLVAWSAVDAPWLGSLDRRYVANTLQAIERLDPSLIVSAHLPHARELTRDLVGYVADAVERCSEGAPGEGIEHVLGELRAA